MKNRNLLFIVLIISGTLFITGCKQPINPEYLGIENINIYKIGLKQSQVKADLKFYNPNNFELKLTHADVVFSLDDHQAAHCIIDSTINIPKLDSFYVPISVQADLGNILNNALKLLLKGKTKINADGYVKLKKSGITFRVPVHYETEESLDFLLQQIQ